MPAYRCWNCHDERWVCAVHQNVPWSEGKGCTCAAEGAPCPVCNTKFPADDPAWKSVIAAADPDHPPAL